LALVLENLSEFGPLTRVEVERLGEYLEAVIQSPARTPL
jgi:hypothetical protein